MQKRETIFIFIALSKIYNNHFAVWLSQDKASNVGSKYHPVSSSSLLDILFTQIHAHLIEDKQQWDYI